MWYKLKEVRLHSDVWILIQYTKGLSDVNCHSSQFTQNAPKGPVLDPVLDRVLQIFQHYQKQGYTTGTF